VTPPRIFTSVDALRGAHGDGSFATPRQTADLVASVEHHMARADAADARIEMAETREERATLERDAAQRALANVVVERDAISADLHRVTMERDGARLSLDAAHEARVKQSLELADALAKLAATEKRVADLSAALNAYAPPCEHTVRGDWCMANATHYVDHADHTTSYYCRKHAHKHDGCAEFLYAEVVESLSAPAGGST